MTMAKTYISDGMQKGNVLMDQKLIRELWVMFPPCIPMVTAL